MIPNGFFFEFPIKYSVFSNMCVPEFNTKQTLLEEKPECSRQLSSLKQKLNTIKKGNPGALNVARDKVYLFSLTKRFSLFHHVNRAGLKIAEIDAVFHICESIVKKKDAAARATGNTYTLKFVDLCCGDGGFSFYLMNKLKTIRPEWNVSGVGMTLKQSSTQKTRVETEHMSFEMFYGESGDGNIYEPKNREALTKKCKKEVIDLVVADGAICVDGCEDFQEIMHQRLFLCETITALSLLSTGGIFVLKIFDTFSSFSKDLIFLIATCFKKIAIYKPYTSRPANSERYLVCSEKFEKSQCDGVIAFLLSIDAHIRSQKCSSAFSSPVSFKRLIPMQHRKDADYMSKSFDIFIESATTKIAFAQISNLKKIIRFCDGDTVDSISDKDKTAAAVFLRDKFRL